MSEQAKKINSITEVDDSVPSYWKQDGVWWLYLPGCGAGQLSLHHITEHEDGTITASPSISMEGHGSPSRRHGYLERGVWREI